MAVADDDEFNKYLYNWSLRVSSQAYRLVRQPLEYNVSALTIKLAKIVNVSTFGRVHSLKVSE